MIWLYRFTNKFLEPLQHVYSFHTSRVIDFITFADMMREGCDCLEVVVSGCFI